MFAKAIYRFLYQASTQTIRSSSGKVVIDSSGTLVAEGATLSKASVSGTVDADVVNARNGLFQGSIDTPSFSSLPNGTGGTSYSVQLSSDKTSQYNNMKALFNDNNIASEATFPCSISSSSSVSFARRTYEGSAYYVSDKFSFLDSSLSIVGTITYFWQHNSIGSDTKRYTSSFEGTTPLVTVTVGAGEIFKFKNIPTAVSGLQSGQVYSDGGTLKIAP